MTFTFLFFEIYKIFESFGYYIFSAISGVIIFLWGVAVGRNNNTEEYKISETNGEILELRAENKQLISKNKDLVGERDLYLNTLSGLRHLLRKGE